MTLSNFRVPLLRWPVLPWLHQHLEIPRWIFILRHSPGICSYKVATIFTKFSHFVNNGSQLKLCSCVHVDFCMLLLFKTLLLQDVCPHRQTPCGAWQGPSLQQVNYFPIFSFVSKLLTQFPHIKTSNFNRWKSLLVLIHFKTNPDNISSDSMWTLPTRSCTTLSTSQRWEVYKLKHKESKQI